MAWGTHTTEEVEEVRAACDKPVTVWAGTSGRLYGCVSEEKFDLVGIQLGDFLVQAGPQANSVPLGKEVSAPPWNLGLSVKNLGPVVS